MVHNRGGSEDELPDLKTIIFPRSKPESSQPLRRSPRKLTTNANVHTESERITQLTLSATSNQRRLSPAKPSPSKRSPLKPLAQASASISIFDGVPILPRKTPQTNAAASAGNRPYPTHQQRLAKPTETDSLLASFGRLGVQSDSEDDEKSSAIQPKARGNTSQPARSATARFGESNARNVEKSRQRQQRTHSNRFVLDEARCDEDLVSSDAQDEDEDENTDLSGFIVDDDAEISYHGSSDGIDSEEERRERRRAAKEKPRRRLQRGRRRVDDSEDEQKDRDVLGAAFTRLNLYTNSNEHQKMMQSKVIDLTSPESSLLPEISRQNTSKTLSFDGTNLFDKFKALKLSPPRGSQTTDISLKLPSKMLPVSDDEADNGKGRTMDRFTTPPATPPRSPSKLKSPSKLLSPSKRGDAAQRSPHRQSMDAFWDLNEINEWNDQFSPKKAPIASPRKNRLAAFDLWSDGEEDSYEAINESSDSLPSPCESPSKSKSRSASPVKAEKQRLLMEKKAKQAEKKVFEDAKEKMANDLLYSLDKNITNSQISKLSASTGGVQIIWSKTLRSTAGRANWRRTVTKATGSPVKGKAEESAPGVVVQHFANIELAVKVIDRPDRLVNTLAHEFCHLANFMISGIRDQPHGASFQNWARKVTSWMKGQNAVPAWKTVEVTTKHGYVIEWKYLWLCVGRDQNKAMELLNIDEEDGCGAEYGRHSKSIDTEKHRCGKCKGRLVQVRPKPRASPMKKVGRTTSLRGKGSAKGLSSVEKMIEVIELSE